jgi:hypothetical protein
MRLERTLKCLTIAQPCRDDSAAASLSGAAVHRAGRARSQVTGSEGTTTKKELRNERQTAALLHASVKSLQGWRVHGRRPAVRDTRPVRALCGAGPRGLRPGRPPHRHERSGRGTSRPDSYPRRSPIRANGVRARARASRPSSPPARPRYAPRPPTRRQPHWGGVRHPGTQSVKVSGPETQRGG